MMLLARTANIRAFVGGDAPVTGNASGMQPHFDTSAPGTVGGEGSRKRNTLVDHKPNKKGKNNNSDQSSIHNGEYTHNRAGRKLCSDFQTGSCGQSGHGGLCPKDRSSAHQCSRCLMANHGKSTCSATNEPHKKYKTNKGTGKGKDKGSSKSNW